MSHLCWENCGNLGVARLEKKPDTEIVSPPADFGTWERERLQGRSLTE